MDTGRKPSAPPRRFTIGGIVVILAQLPAAASVLALGGARSWLGGLAVAMATVGLVVMAAKGRRS
ncbi:hypothetical protein [Actinoplanes sp. N902-109]|uniref:hypothetical protein n=1 Tax=Actinoplanes sp. (strain N902-109) TaxID=649831 RepID=UPI00032942B5|nr:hypothetical protein [Actinoplanes sp. N902-109]AGL13902.1 hypothetical protein L083_0392 [Actinoplanes sp. N902-109]